ncbi:AAA family ATPase [Pararoseomonas indoligenes]|uniref:Pilus assembly protein n=1 Tax=Roseomonas indoligenes TaxID=2820811 RepID=A0A940MZE7_9PROT|nr:pilus assembly protein [Pararoseomonas indoligenes]MBP0493875.1 pilus assembly protein [Pararoseomonas indoligenes]
MLVERSSRREAPQASRPAPPAEEGRYAAPTGDPRVPFLAFVTDEDSEAALRGGLVNLGTGVQVRRGDVRTATRVLEHEETPHVLLVDVTGIEDPFAALGELAEVCTPDVRVLVIGESSNLTLYRRLTRDLGIAEYLYKPLTRETVGDFFGPHVTGVVGQGGGERGGSVVTVSGARGGCGATTIAVNLALQLAEVSRGHVALLDLHLRTGNTGLMLGVRSGTGLRVALEEPERVDSLFLDRSSIPVGDRVRLVAAEEPMNSAPHPTEEGVKHLLAMLTARFNIVVVDTHSPPGIAESIALAMAQTRIVVTAPDMSGIRDTLMLRKYVEGLRSSPVLTVLNREGLPGGLRTKLVEEGLGAPPDFVIPDLPREVPRAAHLGRPAIAESAGFRRALLPVTRRIAGVKTEAGPPSLLARLFGRAA